MNESISGNENNGNLNQPSESKQHFNVISNFLNNEKKFIKNTHQLLQIQLTTFDIGKKPDFSLLLETICFIEEHPEFINHPFKMDILNRIFRSAPEENKDLKVLIDEKETLKNKASAIKLQIKSLFNQNSILKEEQFRIHFKDYLENLEVHYDTENHLLTKYLKSSLGIDQTQYFNEAILNIDIAEVFQVNKTEYPLLFGEFDLRMKQIDEEANQLAASDSLSISSVLQRLELITQGTSEISDIVKEFSRSMYIENYKCYRKLLLNSQENKLDYINKPLICFKVCYDEYLQGVNQIKSIITSQPKKSNDNKE